MYLCTAEHGIYRLCAAQKLLMYRYQTLKFHRSDWLMQNSSCGGTACGQAQELNLKRSTSAAVPTHLATSVKIHAVPRKGRLGMASRVRAGLETLTSSFLRHLEAEISAASLCLAITTHTFS